MEEKNVPDRKILAENESIKKEQRDWNGSDEI